MIMYMSSEVIQHYYCKADGWWGSHHFEEKVWQMNKNKVKDKIKIMDDLPKLSPPPGGLQPLST